VIEKEFFEHVRPRPCSNVLPPWMKLRPW
jgi:hypothetical protein